MHITGSCHCGAIRYQAEADPARVALCHCNDCQTLSGSAWRASARVDAADFQVVGEPKVYVKTAESGTKRGQAFCGECGSGLYAFTPADPRVYAIRLGSVDQRAELPPQSQIWCEAALPWALDISALPRSPKQ
ncbi:GFA family protein [Sphingomonas sp. R-74633]|nr:GFA family protein [Sphingomonas sp. R-74633]